MDLSKVKYKVDEKYTDYITQEDITNCVNDVLDKVNKNRKYVDIFITVKDGYIGYEIIEPPVNRIRRITGYLVGTVDRFNDAKRAEVEERVKHIR